jgi:hypothetical protein
MITLEVPTFVMLPRKTMKDKKINCNLNDYRNANFRVLSAAKNAFYIKFKPEMERVKEEFDNMIEGQSVYYKKIFDVEFEPVFRLNYMITAENKRAFDIANFLPIIQKYADDCLVKDLFFEDDNFNFITEVNYRFGGITGERKCTLTIELI